MVIREVKILLKNNRYTNDTLLNSQISCDEENSKREEILDELEKSDFNNSLLKTMNPDRDNNLLFTARKHCNSVSRSSSKNDTVIENEVYPTIQPKTRLSMRSSSSKAFAVSESVERKMKQCRLPVRTPMMHITGYSSANKARNGYEILNKPRYCSEKKINTVKEDMISKFEVISSEKRTINIIPQCPRYKLDSTRNEISSKEICSLKSKLIFSIIKMLMRNGLRRGFTTWKSFDVRQKVSMEQKSLINQIQ